MISGSEFSVLRPDSWAGERGLRLSHSPLANDLVNHNYVAKPPEKPQKAAFWPFYRKLPHQGTRTLCATMQGPKLHEDIRSLVWDLTLCISSSGCQFVSFKSLLY